METLAKLNEYVLVYSKKNVTSVIGWKIIEALNSDVCLYILGTSILMAEKPTHVLNAKNAHLVQATNLYLSVAGMDWVYTKSRLLRLVFVGQHARSFDLNGI